MRPYQTILLVIITLGLSGIVTQAQDPIYPPDIYITTQDYANLRLGPGENWDVLTRLDYGVTLQATGRSFDSRWIQVIYDGEITHADGASTHGVTYGWVAYWLLVWSGDILDLPVDGVPTIRSARRSGPRITIDSETRYYVGGIDPSTRVTDTVDEPVTVEMTGRIGSPRAGYFWIQFEHEGNYYWTATWEIGVPRGYSGVADGSAIVSYGRLLTQLQQTVDANEGSWRTIAQRWRDLDGGFQTTCNNIPSITIVREDFFSANDIAAETEFTPAITALDSLIENMNNATTLFREICNRDESQRFAAADDVNTALGYIEEANRQLTVVRLFLTPLERRNPLLGGGG